MPGQGQGGSFGMRYAARAAVAVLGLGAKVRADGIDFNASVDANGDRLDGSKAYRLIFAPGDTQGKFLVLPGWCREPVGTMFRSRIFGLQINNQ
jgi:hypothetical protein